MNKYIFRGWNDYKCMGEWVKGSLIDRTWCGRPIIKVCGGEEYAVVAESVGLQATDGIFEGDIFACDTYPFVNDGVVNYHGVVEYGTDPAFLGWYYGLRAVVDGVITPGSHCCGALSDLLEEVGLEVIGNVFEESKG